jgi:hypothetical protein
MLRASSNLLCVVVAAVRPTSAGVHSYTCKIATSRILRSFSSAAAPERGVSPPSTSSKPVTKDSLRLSKMVSLSGLCSRNEAEDWISSGRVTVNGVVVRSAATLVTFL